MTELAADSPYGVWEQFPAPGGEPVAGHRAAGARPVTGPPDPGGPAAPVGGPPVGDLSPPTVGALEPEQALTDFPLRIDESTLREVVEEPRELEKIRFELTKKLAVATDDAARSRLAGLRAVTSRLLGKLNEALDDAEIALQCATATGSARRIAIARTRLARVLQWRGDYSVADELYQRAVDGAIPNRLRATIYHYFATSCYDQGRFLEALQHFETSMALHPNQPPEQAAAANRAFAAISLKASREGFGPFPRTRVEILHEEPPPELRFHDLFRRYGYVDSRSKAVIPPTFPHAHPFSDGVAWVQPDSSPAWSLIDATGQTLIPPTGFHLVEPFREGIGWVLSDHGWHAIDRHGTVVVPPAGYHETRPFQAGLAAVARDGRWGAVDRNGREVIPPQYDAFRTATSDSTYVAGFTSEGLAVVERAGLVGVIDRSGGVVVPITYQQIEVHPVGFLVMPPPSTPDYSDPFRSKVDLADGWGALDRRGDLVVDPVHPNRAAVLEELERLMRDAHPIL